MQTSVCLLIVQKVIKCQGNDTNDYWSQSILHSGFLNHNEIINSVEASAIFINIQSKLTKQKIHTVPS